MKRIFITGLFVSLFGVLSAWASTTPAGQTVYLNVGSYWCCKASYAVYCSGWNPQGFEVMTPVPGLPGVYQLTVSKQLGNRFHFGASNTVLTSQNRWLGDFCQEPYIEEIDNHWSASTPCYTLTNINGSGTWGALPTSTSFNASIDSVDVDITSSCATSSYNVQVTVYFTGTVCALTLECNLFDHTIKRANPTSPFTYTIKGLPAEQTARTEALVVSICSDTEGASPVEQQIEFIDAPTLDCEEVHEQIEVCIGESVTLTATADGDAYEWNNGAETRSLTATITSDSTLEVTTYKKMRSAADNMMVNGDFEEDMSATPAVAPPGFTSYYNYVGVWDPYNYYASPGHMNNNFYCITHNVSYFSPSYADIEPHGGNYYALFDAGSSGYAWKATSSDPTSNLAVEKDTVYLFSYWAAYPNVEEDFSPARLQFRITYVNPADNQTYTEDLGNVYILGQEAELNAWYYQEIYWMAPCNSSSVTISVEDLNSEVSGNDFCLDDIMFQRTTAGTLAIAKKDIYPIKTIACDMLTDTICLGERYTGNGFDITPTEAGTQVYREGGNSLALTVIAPIEATFRTPDPQCNFEGGTIALPFTVQQGEAAYYDLESSDRAVTGVYHGAVIGNALSVEYPYAIEAGTVDVTVRLYDKYLHCDPYETTLTLTFMQCSTNRDTVCVGTLYDQDGFVYDANEVGLFTVVNGTDTLLLTVTDTIDMTIQQPAPLCNVTVDTTLTVTYSIVKGNPVAYSLYFSSALMADVVDQPLPNGSFTIDVPASVDEAVTVRMELTDLYGKCPATKTFTIGRNAGPQIYAKWDDVLFVNNGADGGSGTYIGYQWYRDGVAVSGATQQHYYTGTALQDDGHSYYVVITKADGTTEMTCPVRFGEVSRSAEANPGNGNPAMIQVRHYVVGAHFDIVQKIYEDGSSDVQKMIVP